EAYLGWTSFNDPVRAGRTAFSIEGDVTPLTDMAITDIDGDVVGYLYAMRQCCYVPTIFRTRFADGRMSSADQAVTNEYNENVHNIAVCNFCRSEEHTSELQSLAYLVCRLLLEKKKIKIYNILIHNN